MYLPSIQLARNSRTPDDIVYCHVVLNVPHKNYLSVKKEYIYSCFRGTHSHLNQILHFQKIILYIVIPKNTFMYTSPK